MPDTFAPFVAALADRYRVERELGRGGMATVFLAHDIRHDRPIALKVLHAELSASLGAERFLREIRIAARLRHPRILPVHDSGETAGLLWYTMPFVEGESLRQRLVRQGQLPIEQAVRIASQVLGALGYAHAHGVIHRDIKPENILLEADEAVVADFGVARAISSAGEDRLTETGLAVGTPAYMSPEQATAEKELDGRSDLYAVGCVLYEMLTGQPPFVGTNAQQLVARHLMDTPPPIRIVRATVPDSVERSVMRALAKLPVDRFDSAAEFAVALGSGHDVAVAHPVASTTPLAISASPSGAPWRAPWRAQWRAQWRRVAALAGVAVALALAAYFAWPTRKATLDPNLVAVVPFRIGGAAPALNYLREGMIDLVAARLTGEGSAQAADPSSVMTAWRQASGSETRDLPEADMLEVARDLGAGQLLIGGIVGTTDHLTINATLIRVTRGSARITATVEGVADSLPQLVDRLIAELLTEGTVVAHGLKGLVNTPLPALRYYLEGRSAQRRARYADAVASFGRALDIDSTFALAGLSLATAAGWSAIPGAGRRGLELAWASRDKLSPRDRALVMANVGPNYPETSTLAQHLRAWEQAAELAPDEPDRWYELGDEYYHEAPYLQVESPRRRAADAFKRSIALDSGASSIGHLLEIAVLDDDSASVRRLSALYLARDSSGSLLDFYRWRIAVGLHDEPALRALRARYRQMRLESLWRIMNHAVLDGSRMEDADSAAAAIRAIAGRSSDWQRSKTYLHAFEVNRGRPAAALADTAGSDEGEYGPHAALYERVLDALYGEGDSVSGGQAARELDVLARRPVSGDGDTRATALTDLCVATLWRLSHGETEGAPQAISRLGVRAAGDTPYMATSHMLCAALLEAKYRFSSGAPGAAAAAALDRLDSLMRSGPGAQRNGPPNAFTLSPAYVRSTIGISPVGFEEFANLEVARMRERQGNVRAALAAVRRRPYAYHLTDYLAPTLRERGRLAALAGERAEAVSAYRHYLALRSNPEPSLQPAVDAVRAELAKLEDAR